MCYQPTIDILLLQSSLSFRRWVITINVFFRSCIQHFNTVISFVISLVHIVLYLHNKTIDLPGYPVAGCQLFRWFWFFQIKWFYNCPYSINKFRFLKIFLFSILCTYLNTNKFIIDHKITEREIKLCESKNQYIMWYIKYKWILCLRKHYYNTIVVKNILLYVV